MNLFKKKANTQNTFIAPVSGECIPLSGVADEAFASKLCGDGIAVIPTEGLYRSPVDGVVTGIAESKHAYTLTSTDGLEVLVHIGIDTVALKGEGFTPKAAVGENLRKGDALCEVDLGLLKEKGYDTTSPAVITNADDVKSLNFRTGTVTGGRDTVMEYSF